MKMTAKQKKQQQKNMYRVCLAMLVLEILVVVIATAVYAFDIKHPTPKHSAKPIVRATAKHPSMKISLRIRIPELALPKFLSPVPNKYLPPSVYAYSESDLSNIKSDLSIQTIKSQITNIISQTETHDPYPSNELYTKAHLHEQGKISGISFKNLFGAKTDSTTTIQQTNHPQAQTQTTQTPTQSSQASIVVSPEMLQTQLSQLVKNDKNIQSLLKGPKGDSGPRGSEGGAGPAGPPGSPGASGTTAIIVSHSLDMSIFNGVSYTWPNSQGNASTVLTNDGSGGLSWTSVASGSGDSMFVNNAAITDGNLKDVTATGSVAGTSWSVNTTPSPDDITVNISIASGTQAGVVDTNAQTFAGAKTFSSQITASNGILLSTLGTTDSTSIICRNSSNILASCNSLADAQVSDTLTASNFVGSGSTSNAVDLATSEVNGLLGTGNGGTGNAFFAISGPASTTKTFTFPNSSATVLPML
jgi:hypothetical protein